MAQVVSRSRRDAGWEVLAGRVRGAFTNPSSWGPASRIRFRRRTAAAGLLLVCSVPLTAVAQGTNADRWTFTVTPYLWAAEISGEVGTLPGLPPADVDEPSSASVLEDRAREH